MQKYQAQSDQEKDSSICLSASRNSSSSSFLVKRIDSITAVVTSSSDPSIHATVKILHPSMLLSSKKK